MPDQTPTCQQQQKLIDAVLVHLFQIADLTRATAEALTNRDEARVYDLDRQAEAELGKKERALGALRQHREEHGC